MVTEPPVGGLPVVLLVAGTDEVLELELMVLNELLLELVEVVGGSAAYADRIASRYWPIRDADAHAVAGSTLVPSPHSLKEVTSCHRAPDETCLARSDLKRLRSRLKRGVDSLNFKKPGETTALNVPCWAYGAAGPYWCHDAGCTEHFW